MAHTFMRVMSRLFNSVAQVFGGRVVRAPCGVMHGKTSLIHHSGVGLMQVSCVSSGRYSQTWKSAVHADPLLSA
jgi:anthranilate/para-aminobenzoate synthase component II